jgi:predicted DNA-binding transcriptional regulator YafY
MRDRKAVEMTYQSYNRTEPHSFVAHPYCLKLFKQRWYVLGRSEGYDDPWIFALDERMIDVVPLKKALKKPSKFDAADFFSNYFGVIVDSREPVTVKLKVVAGQARFFESLPLHHSQQIIERTPAYSILQYRLVPTYDFRQELLSHGPNVEVLEPEDLREEMKTAIRQMSELYSAAKRRM